MELTLPVDLPPLDDTTKRELISFLNPIFEVDDESPKVDTKGEIMYIEEKPGTRWTRESRSSYVLRN